MKYLIMGAGPAGLAFANRLKQQGETNFLVLEKEETAVGYAVLLKFTAWPTLLIKNSLLSRCFHLV